MNIESSPRHGACSCDESGAITYKPAINPACDYKDSFLLVEVLPNGHTAKVFVNIRREVSAPVTYAVAGRAPEVLGQSVVDQTGALSVNLHSPAPAPTPIERPRRFESRAPEIALGKTSRELDLSPVRLAVR